jgi:hypothetical protein
VTVREFCRKIVESGNLEVKLAPRGTQRGIHRVRAQRSLFAGETPERGSKSRWRVLCC